MHGGQQGNHFREQQFKGVQREQLAEWLKQPRIQKPSEFEAKTLGESEQSRKSKKVRHLSHHHYHYPSHLTSEHFWHLTFLNAVTSLIFGQLLLFFI